MRRKVKAGVLWLAIFSSLISLYYYLQILRQVYIEPAPEDLTQEFPALTKRPSLPMLAVLGPGLVAILWLGVYPRPLIQAIEAASRALMP